MIEIIHEIKFKNLSRILKNFKKETFQVPLATLPEVISKMNRHFILDTKKRNERAHVFVTVVKFVS